MERYELFYKDILIGVLTVDENTGKHSYAPDNEAVKSLFLTVPLTKDLLEGTDGFTDPIPFFANRLMNMKRWNLKEINYQTDWFLLRKIEN